MLYSCTHMATVGIEGLRFFWEWHVGPINSLRLQGYMSPVPQWSGMDVTSVQSHSISK